MATATQVDQYQGVGGVLTNLSHWFNIRKLCFWGILAITAYLALGPLLFLLWDSVHPGWEIGDQVAFTFASYINVFTNHHFSEMIWNTTIFGVGATTLAVGLGSSGRTRSGCRALRCPLGRLLS